jgi:flagellar export protein FliJ
MQQRIRRFSRILKLRENDRQTEQIVLAGERREENEVLRLLDVLDHEKIQAMKSFSANRDKTCSCSEIWLQRQSIEILEKDIDKGRKNLDDVQHRIARTEERLTERHRDVRMMEGYVDHLKDDARHQSFLTEQFELDDIAVMRYNRFRPLGRSHNEEHDPDQGDER